MSGSAPEGSGGTADHEAAATVKAALLARLAGDERLRGVGLARDGDGFRVEVRVATEQHIAELALPPTVDGVPVGVRAVGDVVATD